MSVSDKHASLLQAALIVAAALYTLVLLADIRLGDKHTSLSQVA